MVSKPPTDPDYAEKGELRSHEQCDTVTSLVISVWSWALAAQLSYVTVPQGLAEALETFRLGWVKLEVRVHSL